MNDVVLRYFECLGRAQPLRHALADAEVAFEDSRVPMDEWMKLKGDRGIGGPYGGLPTLSFGGAFVAETLAIASFLARRLGHYTGLTDEATARLEAIVSNCYIEVLLRVGELIYTDLIYPGADIGGAFPMLAGRMLEKLGGVEHQLPESGFLGGERPVMADFFVAEAVEVTRYLLGPGRDEALRARFPRLLGHAARIRERPAIARVDATRCAQFTMRPDEPAVVERFRALDLSSIGFAGTPR